MIAPMKSILNHVILSIFFLISSFLQSQQYDILIVNGHLIDAKNNIDQKMDIAIKEGRIVAVEKKINTVEGKKVIDAEGLIVSPGLIDMHTHNFMALSKIDTLQIVLLLYLQMVLLLEVVLLQL